MINNKYLGYLNEIRLREGEADQSSTRDSRVLLIDGLNTFIRAYTASPVTNINGEHVGGVSGFLLSVGHAIKAINPTRVVVVFDGKDGSARRKAIYPEYKANRKFKIRLNRSEVVDKEDNQLQQLLRLVEYLEALPMTVVVAEGSEADDVIAYVAGDYLKDKDSQVFIMSSDKDFMQLVDQRVHIWSPTKKKLYYTQDVHEEYNIAPCNFALYRALMGDASDNIPGVEGLGSKTLISRFPKITQQELLTIDDFFEYAKQLAAENPKVKIYQKVVSVEQDIRMFYGIMQLSESLISTSAKLRIIGLLQQNATKLVKLKFHKMLIEDGMTAAIKNVELWLREVTHKLDQFALQD
jgi:DNA polymerase-1